MSEWKRLTPVSHQSNAGQWYRKVEGEKFTYVFAVPNLTDAEALAFATQLVEVKALVEAAKGLREFIRSFDMGGDWQQENYAAIKAYNQALRPFEEAAGD